MCLFSNDQGPESTQASTLCQIKRYLEEPCEEEAVNPLTYWKEHQLTFARLAKVSKSLLGIPASSAPVERLFSIAGKVFVLKGGHYLSETHVFKNVTKG